jgi:hypothetical protein
MKSTEDGRRYNAAHVLDGAMDIHTHETGSTVFQCLTLQLLWLRDLRRRGRLSWRSHSKAGLRRARESEEVQHEQA